MTLRVSVQILSLALVCKLLIIVQMNIILLIASLWVFNVWLMMYSIFIVLLQVDPESVPLVLVSCNALLAAGSYVYEIYTPFFGRPFYDVPIAGWVTILLACVFPPFGMAIIVVLGMYFTAVGQSLDFSSSSQITPFHVSCTDMILSIIAATLFLGGVNFYLALKTRGLAVAKESSQTYSIDEDKNALSQQDTLTEDKNENIAVSIKNLCREFTRQDGSTNKAVNGLTVSFGFNQITSLLGHNGSGKSTTISLLTGLLNPDSGDAFIRGLSVTREMASIRPLLGVCPQTNVLWDLLTVSEHMELMTRIRNLSEIESRKNILDLMMEIGLSDKADTFAKDLSGGQKRKLCTANALIGDPAVIFLDEPTAGMDSSARRDVWEMLLKRKVGKAIVLCTHQMDEADILGDRVVILSDGCVQEQGTPAFLKAKRTL